MDPSGLLSVIDEHNNLRLLSITPQQIEEMFETITGRVTLAGVSRPRLMAWKSLYPELADTQRYRYEYDSHTLCFAIKCCTEPMHDSLSIFFTKRVNSILRFRLGTSGFEASVEPAGGETTFTGFTGDYYPSTQKIPDGFHRIIGDPMPSIVCCAGWSENMRELYEEARVWLLGTRFQTRAVIVLVFQETIIHRQSGDKNFALVDTPSYDFGVSEFPQERELLSNIKPSTEYHNLAAEILALSHLGQLSRPLLGDITSSVHIFRRNQAKNDIVEEYAATVLPAPNTPELQCFSLTFKDLLGQKRFQMPYYHPGEEVLFPLASLRELIAEQMPKQEKIRSYSRAISLIKSHGFWEEGPAPAPRGTKRKWVNS